MKKSFKLNRCTINLFLLGVIALPTFSFASNFDGFYVGAGTGGTATTTDFTTTTNTIYSQNSGNINILVPTAEQNDQVHAAAWQDSSLLEFHMGYGHQLGQSPLYFGGEVLGNFTLNNSRDLQSSFLSSNLILSGSAISAATENRNKSQSQLHLRSLELALDLRPGILLSPMTLLYGRIGAAFNHLKFNTNVQQTVNLQTDTGVNLQDSSTLTFSTNEAVTGLRLGTGLEQFLNKYMSLRADYIYTRYGSINNHGTAASKAAFVAPIDTFQVITVNNGLTGNSQANNISSQAVLLGLDFYFSPQLSATSSWFNAIDYAAAAQNFNGFFVGLKAGATQTRANIATLTSITTFAPYNSIQQTTAAWQNRPLGAVFAGYGHLLGNTPFYLGIEVFANAASRQLSAENQQALNVFNTFEAFDMTSLLSNHLKLQLNSVEYGADLKPGILLATQTLLYGRVGAALNEVKLDSNNNSTTSSNLIPTIISSLNLHQNKNITGLRLGIGLEQAIRQHLGINLDYVYTNYGNIDLRDFINSSFSSFPATFAHESKVTNISSQTATLGVTYHFG